MIKHNRLISASVVLMLIFAMPGMPDLVTKVYAASSVSELLKNLDEIPIFRYSDPFPDQTPSSSPPSSASPSASLPSDTDPLPYKASPSSPLPSPSASLTPDPTAGCGESKIIGVRASGSDGANVPQNTLDKNFNTRWGDYGIGKWVQYELEPGKIACAIDIAWHRGIERTFDFTVSVSNDGSNFVKVFSSKSSGNTNSLERYVIPDSTLQAKYVRITVNGNTENLWASITEVRILSKPSSTVPTAGCGESKIIGVRASGSDGANVPQNTLDKNFNTRWGDYGIGKWVQYELEPGKIACAIDIAWHRGIERTFDFTVSVSNDGSNFVKVFSSKSSGNTNSLERYVIPDSTLQAKYVRITVNGNTENLWASITEVRILSQSATPSVNNTLVYNLTSSETRTILPIQMMLPDGTWSQPVKYNFDTGASWPTDVAPQFLSAFGYGPDGVGSDSSKREAQPGKIRIVGLDKDIDLPVMVQDKAHYDLFREQPPPERYPLVNVKDILTQISMVFASDQTTLRLKGVPIPELADTSKLINLPDFQKRDGTPTSGWQWMRVKFINPSTDVGIEDWFGLNTGDHKLVLKKQSIADPINLPLTRTDSCNYASKSTLVFTEADKPVKLDSAPVQVRQETCDFARGGEPRNFGGGVPFMSKYTMILWDLHRALLPV